jgi:hypothetical protein
VFKNSKSLINNSLQLKCYISGNRTGQDLLFQCLAILSWPYLLLFPKWRSLTPPQKTLEKEKVCIVWPHFIKNVYAYICAQRSEGCGTMYALFLSFSFCSPAFSYFLSHMCSFCCIKCYFLFKRGGEKTSDNNISKPDNMRKWLITCLLNQLVVDFLPCVKSHYCLSLPFVVFLGYFGMTRPSADGGLESSLVFMSQASFSYIALKIVR